MAGHGFAPLAPVVVFLREPREKVFGLLLAIDAAGVSVRALDLNVVEDFLRQEARGDERLIGPSTIFYPMHRVERLERDETVGPLTSYAERFAHETGRDLALVFGIEPTCWRGCCASASRRRSCAARSSRSGRSAWTRSRT